MPKGSITWTEDDAMTRIEELERDYAEAQHQIGEYVDKTAELQAENERMIKITEAAAMTIKAAKDCEAEIERLKAELRGKKIKIETLRAALEEVCTHEWCDIAAGGQYCRLCDARRPEYEGMAYDD
jgi:predicted RNase H-like nuclease (RuvC/YqgF family)